MSFGQYMPTTDFLLRREPMSTSQDLTGVHTARCENPLQKLHVSKQYTLNPKDCSSMMHSLGYGTYFSRGFPMRDIQYSKTCRRILWKWRFVRIDIESST